MNSKATDEFWGTFADLPPDIQQLARTKFKLWRDDAFHPSLHFKEITSGVWSVRIARNYRALARRRTDEIVWFWIGTHQEYDRLIAGK